MAKKPAKEIHADFAKDWMEKIKAGIKYRKKFSKIDKWKDYRKEYRGDWAEEFVPVNRVFSFGKSLIPQVYFRAPRVTVTATRPELVFHAKVVEAVDNWMIREAMLKGTLKRAILNAYHCGIAPVKLGYDSEFGFNPQQQMGEDSSTVTQVSMKESRRIEYRSNVKPGMPWALPVLPEDVIVPPGYLEASSLPWVAHRILRPLDDVKQDQKYNNTKDLEGSRLVDLDSTMRKSPNTLEHDKIIYAELYEVRDVATREVHVFCEDHHLLGAPDALQIEGTPWEFLIFNEDPEYFWGISDVTMIEPQQLELNEVRTQGSRHRKIALLKFLYLKGTINAAALETLLSGQVGPAVEIDGESLANAIEILQPHIPPDLAPEAERMKQDMRETIGMSENQVGAFSPYHGKTATETMEVSGSSDNRVNERKDSVADLLVNIIRKWNQYIFSFWTGERVAAISGPDGTEQWIQYTGDQLEGEYTLNVDPESGFPVSKQLKQQAADGLFKAYGGDQLIDQVGLRRLHLQQFDWIFPQASHLLVQLPAPTADALATARQPHPDGSSGAVGSPGGNQGGGRRPGGAQPIPFERAKAQSEGEKKT